MLNPLKRMVCTVIGGRARGRCLGRKLTDSSSLPSHLSLEEKRTPQTSLRLPLTPGCWFDLYTILPWTILYGIYCNTRWSRGTNILRNSVCNETGKRGAQTKAVFVQRIVLIRAHKPCNQTISCKGQMSMVRSPLSLDFGCGWNLYRSGAKVFTPTRFVSRIYIDT